MTDAAEIINTVRGRNGTYLPKTIERNERLARGVLPKVMRVISRVPFADDLVAAYYAARDPLTPTTYRWLNRTQNATAPMPPVSPVGLTTRFRRQ